MMMARGFEFNTESGFFAVNAFGCRYDGFTGLRTSKN
jgi:hypothetical protein